MSLANRVRGLIAGALFTIPLPGLALAQSGGGFVTASPLTAAALNAALVAKTDYNAGALSATSLKLNGCTIGANNFCVSGSGLITGNLNLGSASDLILSRSAAAQLTLSDGGSNSFTLAAVGGVARFGGSVQTASGGNISWLSRTQLFTGADGVLSVANNAATQTETLYVPANNELRLGGADAASPSAQTVSTQNVSTGTSNTAGVGLTFNGGRSTGTGVGGSIIFQVSPAGSTGSTQNTLAPALTIDSTKTVTASTKLFVTGGGRIGWTSSAQMVDVAAGAAIQFLNSVGTQFVSLGWPSTNELRLGGGDLAAPTAQTLSAINVVAGTSNTAGADFTIKGSSGTGTGAPGRILLQVAPAGTTGTTNNTFVTGLTVNTDASVSIKGTTTGASPSAGNVGEVICAQIWAGGSPSGCATNSTTGVTMTTATDTNITSVNLTAGDWDVSAVGACSGSGVSLAALSISTTSGTRGGSLGQPNSAFVDGLNTTVGATVNVADYRVSPASTTTYYVVMRCDHAAGTITGYGSIYARRRD